MKAIYTHLAGSLALTLTLAACIPATQEPSAVSTPAPAPIPAQAPAATPAPAPSPPASIEPRYESYLDAPQTPGTWVYEVEPSETFALFGIDIENPTAIIRCDPRSKKVGIGRFGTSSESAVMRLQAETGSWVLDAIQRSSAGPMVAAELSANDRTLDAIAITKGRFALEVEGMPTVYLPVSGEVSRVIEDCR